MNTFYGCVLAAPDEETVTITVVDDLGAGVNFTWIGLTDEGEY